MKKENLILMAIILGIIVIFVLNLTILSLVTNLNIEDESLLDYEEISTNLTIEDCKIIAEESERKRVKCNEIGLEVSGLDEFRCYPSSSRSECNAALPRINKESKIIGSCEANFPTKETALADCLSYVAVF